MPPPPYGPVETLPATVVLTRVRRGPPDAPAMPPPPPVDDELPTTSTFVRVRTSLANPMPAPGPRLPPVTFRLLMPTVIWLVVPSETVKIRIDPAPRATVRAGWLFTRAGPVMVAESAIAGRA